MAKIGRNTPCPCGSGKKYKHCCERENDGEKKSGMPPGGFQYDSGSYGGPGRGYMPSIVGYQELGADSLKERLCLVNPEIVMEDEDEASGIAEKDLSAAKKLISKGGTAHDFALSLKYKGYVDIPDFKIIND